MEYPKIETLWNRDEHTHKAIPGALRLAEFGNIRQWRITEKIDGMNVRVILAPDGRAVTYAGRTDNAQMPVPLLAYLSQALPLTRLIDVFDIGHRSSSSARATAAKFRKAATTDPIRPSVFLMCWWGNGG